jgi:hypothetical protein
MPFRPGELIRDEIVISYAVPHAEVLGIRRRGRFGRERRTANRRRKPLRPHPKRKPPLDTERNFKFPDTAQWP